MNIYVKWFIVVGLNSIVGFYVGGSEAGFARFSGMVAGTITWYFLYLSFDKFLQKTGRNHVCRRLFFSAMLRIPIQFLVIPDMFAGLFGTLSAELVLLHHFDKTSFIGNYLTTLFTGFYLSAMCAVLYPMVTAIDSIRIKWKVN